MNTDNIQDKIRKLLALARDKAATEGEAANAMSMATALMAKYNIDHLDDGSPVTGDIRRVKLELWEGWLLTACGRLNGCQPAMGKIAATYYGRAENTSAAWELFSFLCEQIEALYKRDLPKGLAKVERANFRRTYKQAAAIRVYTRAEEILNALRTQDNQINGCTALVVAQSFDQRMAEAQEFLEQKGLMLRTKASKGVRPGFGTAAGRRAGEQVRINEGVTS